MTSLTSLQGTCLNYITLYGISMVTTNICIHGCIDGFSRRMLWLEDSASNKMAEILAKYYLNAVKQYAMPANVKVDDGREHSLVQLI